MSILFRLFRPTAKMGAPGWLVNRLLGKLQDLWWVCEDWFARLDTALEKQRTRRQLLDLTEDQLKDIGITRAQAEEEARKELFE